MENIENKVALITGGSKGIGFGIAEALVTARVNVAVTSRTKSAAEKAAALLNDMDGGRAIAVEADVRDEQSQNRAVETVLAKWGQLDVLVANAGVGHFAPVHQMSLEQWRETIDTNLTGVFLSIRAAVPALRASKGYIITIGSLAGTNFFAGGSAYNASKFGLAGFSQAVMLDLREEGIRVSTIMPGSVATGFSGNPGRDDAWKIAPKDIGQLVIDLLQMNPRTLPSKIEVRPSIPRK
ncbi:MAG TPA: SDR family oxidoreductase [Chryseosolibacter sp.]|nr:SDR family oxidoreductase [Chryseosolibacter sp.]